MVSNRKKIRRRLNASHERFWDEQTREMNKLRKMGAYASKRPIKKRRKGENINVWLARNKYRSGD